MTLFLKNSRIAALIENQLINVKVEYSVLFCLAELILFLDYNECAYLNV